VGVGFHTDAKDVRVPEKAAIFGKKSALCVMCRPRAFVAGMETGDHPKS